MSGASRDPFGLVLVAPPGAGKGTQGGRIAEHYGLERLSSGEMLRAEVSAGTPLGRLAAAYLGSGDLAPTELVLEMLEPRLIRAGRSGGFVLDGFPRSPAQAEALDLLIVEQRLAPIRAVVHLVVGPDELRRRLAGRSGREQRTDDDAATSVHRLQVYGLETEPLLAWYGRRGLVVEIDGQRRVEEVTAAIVAAVDARRRVQA